MKIYVDFGGVVLDTETHLFDGFQSMYKSGYVLNDREYVELLDWDRYLRKCKIIDDSLKTLMKTKKDVTLIGKYCSRQEVNAKNRLLLDHGYDKPVIFIPFEQKFSESELIKPKNNVFIGDTVSDLDDWSRAGGVPFYFHKDGIQTDSWGHENVKYPTIKTLKLINSIDYELDEQD